MKANAKSDVMPVRHRINIKSAERANSRSRAIIKLPIVARGAIAYSMFVSMKLRPIRCAVMFGLKIVMKPMSTPTKTKKQSHMKRRRFRCQCIEKKPFISNIVLRRPMHMYIQNNLCEY